MELTWINLARFQQKNSDSHRLIIIADVNGAVARQNPLGLSIDHDDLASPVDHHHGIWRSEGPVSAQPRR